jgi:peptide/nickel transport system permease protein
VTGPGSELVPTVPPAAGVAEAAPVPGPGNVISPAGEGGRPRRGRVLRRLRRNPLSMVGLVILVLAVLAAVFAPLVAPYSPTAVHFRATLQPPGTIGFGLGTDDLGRDLFSRVLFGLRASLEVGALSVLVALVFGVPFGLLAGYFRALDAVISRFTDLMLAFPFLILAVGLAAIRGASLTNAAVAVGISQIPGMIRVVRSETLRLKEQEFVAAAVVDGAGDVTVMTRHILPNALSAVIVQTTVAIPVAILGEAVLSFLGLGIQPPAPSLGTMLSAAQQYAAKAPWTAIVPGLAIVVLTLAFNLFGDGLRDALDPRGSRR